MGRDLSAFQPHPFNPRILARGNINISIMWEKVKKRRLKTLR